MLLNVLVLTDLANPGPTGLAFFILLTVSLIEKVQKLRFPATPGAAVSSLCGYKALLAR